MMRIYLTIIILKLIAFSSLAQVELFDSLDLDNFNKFGSLADRNKVTLIENIIPDEKYDCWGLIHVTKRTDVTTKDIVLKKGRCFGHNGEMKKSFSDSGFLYGCLPSLCYYYICATSDDNEIQLINSNYLLKEFIGHIDNIAEVELIVNLNDYRIDNDTLALGGYYETKDHYYLYLTEYEPSPEKYWSVKAILSKNGEFTVVEKKLFRETGRRIVY